jgi:hypothetical protein
VNITFCSLAHFYECVSAAISRVGGGEWEVRTLFGEKVHFSKDALAPEKGDRSKKSEFAKLGERWGEGGRRGEGNQWHSIFILSSVPYRK